MVSNGENQNVNTLSSTFEEELFLGEYQPNITSASRIALPKKIREVLSKSNKSVVLSRGFEKCIFGYSKGQWVQESKKTLTSPISDKKSRMLKRYMFSGAYELDFDGQGRIVLPKALLDYAELESDSEVILIGAGDHFEIWNKSVWEVALSNIENEIID